VHMKRERLTLQRDDRQCDESGETATHAPSLLKGPARVNAGVRGL
jgi:hypothetical protein